MVVIVHMNGGGDRALLLAKADEHLVEGGVENAFRTLMNRTHFLHASTDMHFFISAHLPPGYL